MKQVTNELYLDTNALKVYRNDTLIASASTAKQLQLEVEAMERENVISDGERRIVVAEILGQKRIPFD
jgi:hypothetical protein